MNGILYKVLRNLVSKYRQPDGIAAGYILTSGVGWIRRWRPRDATPEVAYLRALDLSERKVFDVGAHHGLMTLFFHGKVGLNGRVLACEPNPNNVKVAWRNLRANIPLDDFYNRVSISDVALAHKPGDGYLWVSDDLGSAFGSLANQRRMLMSASAGGHQVPVKCATFAQVVDKYFAPDFIKVDVEGFELDVLLGAEPVLIGRPTYRPEWFIELHTVKDFDVIGLLTHFGYKIFGVEQASYIGDGVKCLSQHIHATHPGVRKRRGRGIREAP